MPKNQIPIHGHTAPGFEAVKEVFTQNFHQRGEIGAACAVYRHGEKIVDLWGGYKDAKRQEEWQEDTLILVFSTTKGVSSMAMAHAHSNGLFELDAPVAQYWPDFAANGKEAVTVRQLLSHQAGVCAIDEPMDLEILGDNERLFSIIAKQKPAWEPGTRHGYHGVTLGWFESGLLSHADPKGRTVGQYFAEEIAKPLDLEFYIGIPESLDRSRIATLKGYPRWKMLFNLNKLPSKFVKAMLSPSSLTAKAFGNPKVTGIIGEYNKPALQYIEIPAANGIGQVRSIAKAYGEFATGGKTLGIKQETLDILHQPAQAPSEGKFDEVLRTNTEFSFGYVKPFEDLNFGSDMKAFGTPGAGGSFAFADPATGIGFAYAMNKAGFYLWDDPREKLLRDAVYDCLEKVSDQKAKAL